MSSAILQPLRQGPCRSLWQSLALMVVFLCAAGTVAAREGDARLYERLRLDDVVDALIREGGDYGDSLHADLIPDVDADAWREEVARIYDRETLRGLMRDRIRTGMRGQDLSGPLAYFDTATGRELIALELSAREVLADPVLLQASADRFRYLLAERDARARIIDRMVRAGDMVAFNVAGTLNANLMFYRGMKEGGALALSDEQMIHDVWSQEAVVRTEAADWIYGVSLLAYEPLKVPDLRAYAAFWETPAGQALNVALFAAYDDVYAHVSLQLGRAVARHLLSEAL